MCDHTHQLRILSQHGNAAKDRITNLIKTNPVLQKAEPQDMQALKELEKKFPEVDSAARLPSFCTSDRISGLQFLMDAVQDAVTFINLATEILQNRGKSLVTLQLDSHPELSLMFISVFNSVVELCHLIHRITLLRGIIAMYKVTSLQNAAFNTRTYFTVHDFVSETTANFAPLLLKRMPDARPICIQLLHSSTYWLNFDLVQSNDKSKGVWEADFGLAHTVLTSPLMQMFWYGRVELLQNFVVHVVTVYSDLANDTSILSLLGSVLDVTFTITIHGAEVLQPHAYLKAGYKTLKYDKAAKVCSDGMVNVLRSAPRVLATRRTLLLRLIQRAYTGCQNNPLNLRTKAPMLLSLLGMSVVELNHMARHWTQIPNTKQKLQYHKAAEWQDRGMFADLLVATMDMMLLWSGAVQDVSTYAEDIIRTLYLPNLAPSIKTLHSRVGELNKNIPCLENLHSVVVQGATPFDAATFVHDCENLVNFTLDTNYLANTAIAAQCIVKIGGAVVWGRIISRNTAVCDTLGFLYYYQNVLREVFTEHDRFMYVAKLAELFPRAVSAACPPEVHKAMETEAHKFVLDTIHLGINYLSRCSQGLKKGIQDLYNQVHTIATPVPLPGEESRVFNTYDILENQQHIANVAADMQSFSILAVTSTSQKVSALTLFLSNLWASVSGNAVIPQEYRPLRSFLDAMTMTLFRVAMYYPISHECEILAVMPQIRFSCSQHLIAVLDAKRSMHCSTTNIAVAGDVKGVRTIHSTRLYNEMSALIGQQPTLTCLSEVCVQRIEHDVKQIRQIVESKALSRTPTDCSEVIYPVTSLGYTLQLLKMLPATMSEGLFAEIREIFTKLLSPASWSHYSSLSTAIASIATHHTFKDMLYKPEIRGFKNNIHSIGAVIPFLFQNPLEIQRFVELTLGYIVTIPKPKPKDRTVQERTAFNNAVTWLTLCLTAQSEVSPFAKIIPVGLVQKCRTAQTNRGSDPTLNPFI